MKILIKDNNDKKIFDTLDDQCYSCEKNCSSAGHLSKCPISSEKEIRQGKIKAKRGSFFLCADKTFAKTTNLFKEKLSILVNTVPEIENIYKKAEEISKIRDERIAHNLKTLNAKAIQEQNNFILPKFLPADPDAQISAIKKRIKENPKKAAHFFLNLERINAAIKTELSAHEKLSANDIDLSKSKQPLPIQAIIQNLSRYFSFDFKAKEIKVSIFTSEKNLIFDYDTIRVALWCLFENASKYIQEKSTLIIEKKESENEFAVVFDMMSIHIEKDERAKIFEDGYSGVKVKKVKKQGKGLGMGMIKKALELNDATIRIDCGEKITKDKGIDYSHNKFLITFKVN